MAPALPSPPLASACPSPSHPPPPHPHHSSARARAPPPPPSAERRVGLADGHVAALRWQGRLRPSPNPPPRRAAPAADGALGSPTTIQAAHPVTLRTLQPGADLNQPPQNSLTASLFGADADRSPGRRRVRTPVLRERDWGERDLFSSLRTSIEFETAGLAGMGGAAEVHFIAAAEQMKRLFMLPYSPERVAFPVHRVGSALVIDGMPPTSVAAASPAGGGRTGAVLPDRKALVDALGRIMLSSDSKAAASEQQEAAACSPSSALALLGGHGLPAGGDHSLFSNFLCHSVDHPAHGGGGGGGGGEARGAEGAPPRAAGGQAMRPEGAVERREEGAQEDEEAGEAADQRSWTFWKPSKAHLDASAATAAAAEAVAAASDGSEDGGVAGARGEQPEGTPAGGDNTETRWTFWSQTPSPQSAAASASSVRDAAERHEDGGASRTDDNTETRWTFWSHSPAPPPAALQGAPASRKKGAAPPAEAAEARALSPAGGAMQAGRPKVPQVEGPSKAPCHDFRQVVHWQLREMGMLLGTNQLVFSTSDHPSISLRLCDMAQPIRPLAILDFWLDNILANIPALAVCGHVNGRVKGYQVLDTDDLPHWPGADFDADAVIDNGHALLSFLRAHCTRPGGSYWVLKEPDANLVRVFDLQAFGVDKANNPFAHGVAVMCFRMAQKWHPLVEPPSRNLEELRQRRELLLTCTELLDALSHPLLASLVHLQLAEAYGRLGVDEQSVRAMHADSWGEQHDGTVAIRDKERLRGALREVGSKPLAMAGLLQLLQWLRGALPAGVWGHAAALAHHLEALHASALAKQAQGASAAAEEVDVPPEVSTLEPRAHHTEIVLSFANSCAEVARALVATAASRPPAVRLLLAGASLAIARIAAQALLLHALRGAPLPPFDPLPSPLPSFPLPRSSNPSRSPSVQRAMELLCLIGQVCGDAEFELAGCASGAGAAPELNEQLAPLREWLGEALQGSPAEEAAESLFPGSERPQHSREDNLHHACVNYWWSLRLAAEAAGGGGAPAPPRGVTNDADEMPLRLIRRLGCMLNELGQFRLSRGELAAAEDHFHNGICAFTFAADHANVALLYLNLAVLSKRRAALQAVATAAARRTLHPSATSDGEAVEVGGDIAARQLVVQYQRKAYAQLAQLRGRQPQLRGHVVAQLAQGEAALGNALHDLVADGKGTEALLKRAGEALSNAQQFFEELGERAEVQLMMRRQGSLNLAAALQERRSFSTEQGGSARPRRGSRSRSATTSVRSRRS